MKYILITLLLLSVTFLQAQSNTTRIAALEKQQTAFKSDIKFLRAGKTADSLNIIFLMNLTNQLSSVVAKSIELQSQQFVINKALMDSIIVLKVLAIKEVSLYIDTKSLGFKEDTVYNPQYYKK